MKRLLIATVLTAAIFTAACQTTYQEGNLTGGVRALPITSNTYRITANGNGYTSQSTIQDYVLLKAAETTLEKNATHFIILGTKNTTRREIGQTATTANMIGDTLWINPGMTYDVIKPGQDTMIKVFRIRRGRKAPTGAYNAQEVFSFINPRVKRPKDKTNEKSKLKPV